MCPGTRVFKPRADRKNAYEVLYGLFRDIYFGFGDGVSVDLGRVLPTLRAFRLGEYR